MNTRQIWLFPSGELVEPVMILGLGAVIGAVLLGIMVPLWRMYGYMA